MANVMSSCLLATSRFWSSHPDQTGPPEGYHGINGIKWYQKPPRVGETSGTYSSISLFPKISQTRQHMAVSSHIQSSSQFEISLDDGFLLETPGVVP